MGMEKIALLGVQQYVRNFLLRKLEESAKKDVDLQEAFRELMKELSDIAEDEIARINRAFEESQKEKLLVN